MGIVPDTKDWTWVVNRPCPQCGFDASSLPTTEIVPLLLSNAQAWSTFLGGDPARLRRRVSDDRWSPLEYACHVRDVFRLYDERLQLMLTRDNPTYPNWDQDQTAVEEHYNDQDPGAVATELRDAADGLAARFASVEGDRWERSGTRSDGATFTMVTFGRYMIHDPVHHLHDVTVDQATMPSGDAL